MFGDSVMYTNTVDNYTVSGHVVGMLDRDQRTAKLRCDSYRQSAMFSVFHSHNHCCLHVHVYDKEVPHEKLKRRYLFKGKTLHSTRIRKNNYLWNTLIRLKKLLFVGIYVLSLVNLPYSLAAPVNQMAEESFKEWWINPLGFPDEVALSNSNTNAIANDTHLLSSIVDAANQALQNAKRVLEEFTDKAYHQSNPEQFFNDWKEAADKWDWLPTRQVLHKELNEPIQKDYLETLTVDNIGSILNSSYRYLQMTAVGLEQIVIDKKEEDPLYQNFSYSRHRLRLVLTEVQNALVDHEMYRVAEEYIRMDIIPESYKTLNTNATEQNLRDCIIYAAYLNTLQYVIEVFNYLKGQLPNSP